MSVTTRIQQWLKLALLDSARGNKRGRRHRGHGASVESLESRTLLTAYSVTNLNDEGAGSLRDAISQANANSGADEIAFATSGTITLTSGQMAITDSLTITGNGAAATIVDGNLNSRIFDITDTAGNVTLAGLTLTRAMTTAVGRFGQGGAIRSASYGSLNINQCTVSGCSTTGLSACGGAISLTHGAITINQSTITGNSTKYTDVDGTAYGGAIYSGGGAVTLRESALTNNSTHSSSAKGGAVFTSSGGADVTITDSTVIGNFTPGNASNGGAVYCGLGKLSVERSTLSGNYTLGEYSSGGALLAGYSPLSVNQCTFSGNSTFGKYSGGSAIRARSLSMSQSTISGNMDSGPLTRAGALYLGSLGGILTPVGHEVISQSTITGNRNANGAGGAIYSQTSDLNILNSIIAGNIGDASAPEIDISGYATGIITVTNSLIGDVTSTGLVPTGTITPDTSGNFLGGSGQSAIDPKLSPLLNHGGPTLTHALLPGSLAIDHGDNALAVDVTNSNAALTKDQRGLPYQRIFSGVVDMGATEWQIVVDDTLVVDSAIDENDGDYSEGNLSLREAVQLVNAVAGPNTINFAPALTGATILLNGGQLLITDSVTINGPGIDKLAISGDHKANRVFLIDNSNASLINVAMNGLTIRDGGDGVTNVSGGGIHNSENLTLVNVALLSNDVGADGHSGGLAHQNGALVMSGCTVSDNHAGQAGGGGIKIFSGTATITNTTISGNSAVLGGGGINFSDGELSMSGCTISGNSANLGGGIWIGGGTATVLNSTVSGNSATHNSGGITVIAGTTVVRNSTITGNRADSDNNAAGIGGGMTGSADLLTIHNTIVAGNFRGTGAIPDDVAVLNAASSFNLIGDSGTAGGLTNGMNGNIVGNGGAGTLHLNTILNPTLANNGGPAKTHALVTGSPAIDRGSNSLALNTSGVALTSDQRGPGFTRILDGDLLGGPVVDIGAFEAAGIRLTSPNSNAFTLRPTFIWTPIAGATSYNIQINNESTNVAHFHDATTSVASYTPTVDLVIGKFKMWVRPVFTTGPGNWSAPQLFNNLTPATWQSMSRVQLTSRPTLRWNALPGAAKYDVWIDNYSTGQKQLVRQEVTGTSFTPAADLPLGLFRAWIRGIDAKGNYASWSILQEALVVPGPAPVGPLGGTFDRTPTFSWNAVTGAASYELYVRNQITGAMVINGQSVVATDFTPASNLTDGPYRWWTLAVSPSNFGLIKSGGSNTTDIYVGGRPTIIAPVAGSSTSDRTPTFTWRAVDGAAGYQLTVNRINIAQAGIISQTGLTTTSFTPTTDLAAGTFRAWVRAVSSTGELSPWSIEVNFSVTATDPAIDSPATDLKLTGLLASALAQPDDGDPESSPTRTVEHPQTEATAHGSDFEVAIQMRPSNLTVWPDAHVQKQNDLDVDRIMKEFALHEFTTAVIPPL